MLKEGLDVYTPMVDDMGIDAVVRKFDGTFLEVQIKSVKSVDGQDIYLAGGNVYEEGEDKAALAIILGLFVCILLLTIKGKNAEIPAGFAFNASVGTTTTIAI